MSIELGSKPVRCGENFPLKLGNLQRNLLYNELAARNKNYNGHHQFEKACGHRLKIRKINLIE